MIQLTIDNRVVEVAEGATLLEAAESIGIEIPTLCHLKGLKPCTSCMVCLVEVAGRADLLPSCGTPVAEGMVVTTSGDRLRLARKAALELLLSDHLGDCMGPCQVACPAGMDIPGMIRQIAAGDMAGAMETVMADIALPRVLGRICSAPCEKTCRRTQIDQAVSICLLKRAVGDTQTSFMPETAASTGKTVAIVGSGPAGLSAAYTLQTAGIQCTLFDQQAKPGGMLRTEYDPVTLPGDVLDAEIDRIRQLGTIFEMGHRVDPPSLTSDFDAVFLATGLAETRLTVDRLTYQTAQPGLFAGGDLIRGRRFPIRSLADGKEAAIAIQQYVLGQEVTGVAKPFNTRMGRLSPEELDLLAAEASSEARVDPDDLPAGYHVEQARREALRCLHCDCRKPADCKLRQLSQAYDAKVGRYKGQGRSLSLVCDHDHVIYESGKCISCGICVQITETQREALGLTFVGRGFDLRVAVPLDESLAKALSTTAQACIEACPTGALVGKEKL